MKKVIFVFAIAIMITSVIAACKGKTIRGTENTKGSLYTDTVGLAQFQEWKVRHERLDPNRGYEPGSTTAGTRVLSNKRRTMSSESSHPAKTRVKKGWSKAAKGTVIGATTGAILGAVIDKNHRVAGGVIGGMLGGGIGYGIGRHKDKKDRRHR